MLPYLYRNLEIAEKYRDAHRAARTMVGIGDVYRYKNDHKTAKEAYEIALKIYKGLGAKELAEIVEKALEEINKET
jgi:predicted negative regulator of RcsB-dependent stress response